MKVGKPTSKRVPVRLRHKIQKASAAKQRKQRKDAKSNPQWRSRLKKDPGVPNLFPYKAKILAEIEEGKRRKEEEAQKKREVAKAQRLGTAVPVAEGNNSANAQIDEEEDELIDDASDFEDDDEMDVRDESNPMAALLASAQARAQAHPGAEDQNDESADDDDGDDWQGIDDSKPAPGQATRKTLPKQALADPIKAIFALLERMQKTADGIQRLVEHYQTPPLATAGDDLTSRFLVEVARKRGRLGRGGIPNLHSAALIVLGDVNEERLILPNAPVAVHGATAEEVAKRDVQIVSQMAEPFRVEGLFGDSTVGGESKNGEGMVVQA